MTKDLDTIFVSWNGKDLPEELRYLPAGRYAIQSIDEAPNLSSSEEDGIIQALESVRLEKTVNRDEAEKRIKKVLNR